MTGERQQGKTNLMTACEQGRALEAKIILQKKPQSISIRDKHGKTALHYCAESGALACAQLLVSNADRTLLDAPDSEGFTPLHLSVISGHKSIARLLLRAGADPDSVDKERHSVVHWAAVCGDTESLELLLNHGANPSTPDILGAYPIHYAAQMCGAHNLNGKDPETGLNTLKKLVQKGASIQCRDKDGREPLLWAASAGSSEAVLVLFTAGTNISTSDKDGLTALHCAASRGHTACVETLITLCGSKVDAGDHIGCSPLFYAAAQGQADCTQVLLKHGADPNRQDNKGRTPAHCASLKGRLEILRILDSNGADLFIRNSRGNLPLHEAVVSGRKDLVQWLLQQCPRAVNATNINGRTALHIAAQRNNVEMCEVLIDYGAFINPLMVNAKGFLMTPLDASVYQGNQRCAKYLQLHGAVPATKVLENNDINRNLLFSLGNYAYNQKERSDEEPPSSAIIEPTRDILQTSNARDAQTRTIRGGQQPPLPKADVPPESELTNVISEEAADASVHIHLTRDDLWSLWESLMQELTSEMSGSELSQGSEQKQKYSRNTSEVRQLKPILTNVYLRRESGRSQVIAGESIFDKTVDQDDVRTRSMSEDPRLRHAKRATDDFKATLPRVSEAEKSKSTEEERYTASSHISGMDVKEQRKDDVKADGDSLKYFTDSVGSDTENVSSITGTKTTRLRKRRSDARPWVKELEESETSSANRQEQRKGNPYMKRYFQRQARVAEMRKYLESQNFQNEDEYHRARDSRRQITEKFEDSQEPDYDDEYREQSTRFPNIDHSGKSKRSKKDSKYHSFATEGLKGEASSKLHRSKASSDLYLDSIHSPLRTSKRRSKDYKQKTCDCVKNIKDSEVRTKAEKLHSEECRLKRRHGIESPRRSGKKKHGTSPTRDMGRKSSKIFLEVPSQHSAAASDERSEDIAQEEEEMKLRQHHYHHHHHHYHHHHYHSGSATPEEERYTSKDHHLEKHHKHKRHYHRKRSGRRDKSYSAEIHSQRQTFSDGEYEQAVKDIYSGYDIPRSKSEMSGIPWYGTRDVLIQSPVPEISEKESSEIINKDEYEEIKTHEIDNDTEKSESQAISKQQQSNMSETFGDYEKSFSSKEDSDNSKQRRGSFSKQTLKNQEVKSTSSVSGEKLNSSESYKNKNDQNGISTSVLRTVKEASVRREVRKPGKPPLRPAQSFSGTLSHTTKDIPLKQKSQSARIEKDLPEIKVFSVEGDETNILVRTDFELKDVTEASEITSNGENFDKNSMNESVVRIPTQKLISETEVLISEKSNMDEDKKVEISAKDSSDVRIRSDVAEEKQMNREENLQSEIHSKKQLEEKYQQNDANSKKVEVTKGAATEIVELSLDAEIPGDSKEKKMDLSNDELSSSSDDEPDEILYRDENYAPGTPNKIVEEDIKNIKILEEKEESSTSTEMPEISLSTNENAQQIEENVEINDKNLLNVEGDETSELNHISNENVNTEADNSEVKDTTHLNVLSNYERETSVSNEDNEEKSPFYPLQETLEVNTDENAVIATTEYSEQNKLVADETDNFDSTKERTDEKIAKEEEQEENITKLDEKISSFQSNADNKSEYEVIKETCQDNKKIETFEETVNKEIEEDYFDEEDLTNANGKKDSKLSKEPLTNENKESNEEKSSKVDETNVSELDRKTTKSNELKTEVQREEQNDDSISKPKEEHITTEADITKSESLKKDDENEKKDIDLVEETARQHVLNIIQQAESEIQKKFHTNTLESQDFCLLSAKEDMILNKLSLQSQDSAINGNIDIQITKPTPNYEESPFVDENANFSEPESASEAETKFNTDSEDTQPEPDLDIELLSEKSPEDDEPSEIKRMESTPDLVHLAKTLEAETRGLTTRNKQEDNQHISQHETYKEQLNERAGKSLKANHNKDTEEKQSVNSRTNHNSDVDSKQEEMLTEDKNENTHEKHRRKSRDNHNRDSHVKHRRNSKAKHLTDENGNFEASVGDLKGHDSEITKVHKNISENGKKYQKILEEGNGNEIKEEELNNKSINQRKMSVVEKLEENSKTQQTNLSTISNEINASTTDRKSKLFPSAEVQTDITGETKISEIGINVEKEISSHIGFNRSISVQTSDYDTSVIAVLEKVQKEESQNIATSTETQRTISIQTEGPDLRINPILDQSDEIKQVIRTANYNDISGKSRSLATQCIETPQSSTENAQKAKTVSVAVDATKRSPERQNPGAVFYTTQNKVINESPKKENIGALFYAAPAMNDRYDISSISTPNLYIEQESRNKQMAGRRKIPRSTIRDRSLESEKAVAIANSAFRRLNSKGELTVFNSSLINIPVPIAESKPSYRREYSNLEKSGFLWVHFGSGSSPITSIKRKPNLTSQKIKRESKLAQNNTTYRNISKNEKIRETGEASSINITNRRNEIRNEGKANIYSRTRAEKKTVEASKSSTTKSKTELNEALHVSSKVLTNKTSIKSDLQTFEKALYYGKQNQIRSRIPYKYSDHILDKKLSDLNTNTDRSRLKNQNAYQSKGKIPEIVKNEPSPRRAIPRLCRENSLINNSSEQANIKVKNQTVHDEILYLNKNELLDDIYKMENKLDSKYEKTAKSKESPNVKRERKHETHFHKFNQEKDLSTKNDEATAKGQESPKIKKLMKNETDFHKFNQEEDLSAEKLYFDETNSKFDENEDVYEPTSNKKPTRKEKINSSRKRRDISNEVNIDSFLSDDSFDKTELDNFEREELDSFEKAELDSFEKTELENLVKDDTDTITHQYINNENKVQNLKEKKRKSPKKSRKKSSGKKEKQSPKKKENVNTEIIETNYDEREMGDKLEDVKVGDIKNYLNGTSKENKDLEVKHLDKDNKKLKSSRPRSEGKKSSEIIRNNRDDILNTESMSNQEETEDYTRKDLKIRSSSTSKRKSSKNSDKTSPKRREGDSSRRNSSQKKHDERSNNHSERKDNDPNNLKPNNDSNQSHSRLSETAKSSSLDEGDVKLVIERKKDPDFSIKISMKDKQKRNRKQKEPNNTDFSSTHYESDQSYVKDSGYISTTESVHRHRRSITIDLGHTRAKINAGMKHSSTSNDEENDKDKISLPDVAKRTDVDDDGESKSEQQNRKISPNKVLPSKLPVLHSPRHRSSSMVLSNYSRTPRRSSPTSGNQNDVEADSNNFDSKGTKSVKEKSSVRQVGHVAEKSSAKFTRYGSGIPIYRAQSDSNLQKLGKPSPRFSGQSLSTPSIAELNDLRIPVAARKMDRIKEHSYSSSDIPERIDMIESNIPDDLKLPSILLSRPEETGFYGSPLSNKSIQSFSPRSKQGRSPKHSSPISSRVFTPNLGYLKLPILQQPVRCRCNIEPYEYWDGRRTRSAVDCVANLHFLSEEELAQFDQRLWAIGRRTSFSSETVKRRSSPSGFSAIRTQTLKHLRSGRKSAESLTFHVDHDRERNSFRLPTEKLKKNKKWKVTFTIGKSKKDKKGKTKEPSEQK